MAVRYARCRSWRRKIFSMFLAPKVLLEVTLTQMGTFLAICKLIRYKVSSPNNNIILILSSIYLMYRHVHQMVTVRRLVYNHATAVILQGKPTATDSWFPGYSWTIAHCAHCARHIGWHFTHDSRGTRDTFTTEVPINDNLRWFAPREQRRKRIKTDDGRVAMFW